MLERFAGSSSLVHAAFLLQDCFLNSLHIQTLERDFHFVHKEFTITVIEGLFCSLSSALKSKRLLIFEGSYCVSHFLLCNR